MTHTLEIIMTNTGETKIEVVTITHKGKDTIWDVVDDQVKKERRAYLRGTTMFYDMPKFEAGLLLADKVERVPA